MGNVSLRGIRKSFGSVEVIKGVDLEITDGEFMVFVGPSGCGKSTTLRMIAGLETVTAGDLHIDGNRANDLRPADRGAAMVFQSYALYPHMTVAENMGFALKMAGVSSGQRTKQVQHAAEVLRITDLLGRFPKELSGGQRQRVAIGRAIVRAPKVFLFDEPLSNLDAALRGQTRIEIAKLHRDLGATTVYVTHDQVEAMTLADRVVVLRDGMIEQVGTPLELYDKPANQFVAQFIGTPQMNIVSVADLTQLGNIPGIAASSDGFVGLRPENVMLLPTGQGQFQAKVELVEALGAETLIYVTTDRGTQLVARQNTRTNLSVGSDVGVSIDAATAHFFDAKGRVTTAAKTL